MAVGSINKRSVDAQRPQTAKFFLWDDSLKGFGLKVSPAGGKVYIFQYRLALPGAAEKTSTSVYTIGPHGSPWTPATARAEAERVARMVKQGIDPNSDKQAKIAADKQARADAAEKARLDRESRFSAIAEKWLDALAGKWNRKTGRPASKGYQSASRWIVRDHLLPAFGERPIAEIGKAEINAVIAKVPEHQGATRVAVHDRMTAIWAFASQDDLADVSVFAKIQRPAKPESRDRVLADKELALIWKALPELHPIWTAAHRLLIVTAKRRTEVFRMQWGELDRATATWLIPGRRVKNGVEDLIPLSDAAIAELDAMAALARERAGTDPATGWPKSGLVFSRDGSTAIGGSSNAKLALDAAVAELNGGEPIPHWTLHDFRRTAATGCQRLGVRMEVVEALLNHSGQASGGVTAIYARHNWAEEKREALTKWALHVQQAVAASEASNVIPLRA